MSKFKNKSVSSSVVRPKLNLDQNKEQLPIEKLDLQRLENFRKPDIIRNNAIIKLEAKLKKYYSHSILKYIIPSKRREEIIGDLIETRIEMMVKNFPFWKIKFILSCYIIMIIFSLFKVKLNDFGSSKKQVEK